MSTNHIILDPTYPICWESTETLRIGFETATVRIVAPTPQEQRLISSLREGVTTHELPALAKRCGLSPAERHALLLRLEPVLVRARGEPGALEPYDSYHPEQTPLDIHVFGHGSFATELQQHLIRAGAIAKLTQPDRPDKPVQLPRPLPSFAVVVERFFGPATVPHALFSNEVPHLPICLTDRSMFAGPIVLPGGSPCHACVELHRVDAEPLITVLAAQIFRAIPAAETSPCAELAAALTLVAYRQWQAAEPSDPAVRLQFPVRCGKPSFVPAAIPISTHPKCSCALFYDTL